MASENNRMERERLGSAPLSSLLMLHQFCPLENAPFSLAAAPLLHTGSSLSRKGELANVASGLEPAEHWGPCTALKSLWLAVLAALLLASSDALPASLLFQHIPRLEAAPALPLLTRGWVGSSSWAQSPKQGEGCVLWLLMIPAVNSGMPLKVSWESYTYFCLAAGMTAVK